MDYFKIYNDLIQYRKQNLPQGYFEEHHIIPEHFFKNRLRKGPAGWLDGDPNNIDNLVKLTGREHYIAHQLLVKMYPQHPTLVFAAHKMTSKNNSQRMGRSNNKLYEWLRIKHAKTASNALKGKKQPNARDNKGENNPMFGKKHSAESIAKNSAAQKYRPNKDSRTVICVELNKVFLTFREAADFVGLKSACGIKKAVTGERNCKTAAGYTWRYHNE